MQQKRISLPVIGLGAAALCLSACGGEPTQSQTPPAPASDTADNAPPPSDANDSAPADMPDEAATATETRVVELDPSCDRAAAERAMTQCKVCHSIEPGAANLTGPNLFGVYGREAAALDGFAYSPTLRNAGIVWNEETLDGFLESPPRYLPGNRMAFGGVRNEDARAALICYLKALK